MFKSWRKATAGSTAGRIGRRFHRVLSRVALPAVLIAALVATPLQILGDPGAVQAESAGVGVDVQNIPDRFAQTEEEAEPILVSFAETEYRDVEGGGGVEVQVNVSAAPDSGETFEIPIAVMNTNLEDQFTLMPMTVTMQSGDTEANFTVTATDDTEDDGDHNLLLTFGSNLPEGVALGTPNITTVRLVDDDGPGIQISLIKQTVHEDTTRTAADTQADAATWTVRLTAAPSPDETVTVAITSSDPGAATVSPATLTFEAGANNWNQTQEVTVKGIEDFDFNAEMVTFSHSASGANYGGAEARTVRVTVTDNDTPALVLSPTGVSMDEGGRAVYRVRLNGPPSSRVRISITNPDSGRIGLSTSRLAFDAGGADWNRWRNIYIDAHDDEDIVNNGINIQHSTDGSGGFEDVTATLPIFVEDDDKPGFKISTYGETIAEDGEVTWQVQLNTEPTADVIVSLASSDADAATVSPAQLTFTTSNWNRNQDVTVKGVDDGDVGDERVAVSHIATGGDYAGLRRSILVIVNDAEKDKAGIKLSTTALTVGESSSNTFDVSLAGGVPKGTVTIAVVSSDTDNVTVDNQSDSLTFNDTNWDDPQTVTISAQDERGLNADDTEDETGIRVVMTATATTAGDEPFNGLVTSVNVTVEDDDKVGIKLSTGAVTVLEGTTKTNAEAADGSATWTVALNTAPATGTTVKVAITSSNPSAATVNPAELTFDSNNYQTAQDVIVTGEVDDDFLSNMVIFTHAVTEGTYAAANRTVTVTANDTATPSIVLGNVQPATETDPNILFIDEGVTRYVYTVALSHRPTSRVRIAMPNPHADNLTLSTSRLAFEPGGNDWSRPRNIYVDALPDENNENDTYPITHTAHGRRLRRRRIRPRHYRRGQRQARHQAQQDQLDARRRRRRLLDRSPQHAAHGQCRGGGWRLRRHGQHRGHRRRRGHADLHHRKLGRPPDRHRQRH